MFSKILIANRGEIACRIIATARKMGIATVAVYSEADRDAPHVALADEAVAIGPAPAAQSYLAIDKIIAAARETGAEAVHPGYGFLSENAAFARALTDAGLTFIGPNVGAIEAMGDKLRSKEIAAAAGVSTIPGHAGAIADAEEAVRVADRIGYPVMLKASAGGGGKGMRIARSAEDVREGFARAQSEAKASFGDDRILIERFIEQPRHIEIQILADGHGNIIHLGERECSIQRRNQKIVEEAPSPFVDADMRARMAKEAIALARAVDYQSAGTVEFIVDRARNFYFLEMNTRLQVEHPVTEMVTGLDLVEEMIRIAAGEPLRLGQDDIALEGWAIECRIYAEDPSRGFLPSSGRLKRYRPPEVGPRDRHTVRLDSGVVEGGEITMHYDPMIAKLVTHGRDREAAIAAMARALDCFHIDGIAHNIPFLGALMAHPRWRAGELATTFVHEVFGERFTPRAPEGDEARLFATVGAAIDHLSNMRRSKISQQMPGRRVSFPSQRIVRLGPHEFRMEVTGALGAPTRVAFLAEDGTADAAIEVRSDWWPGAPIWHGEVGGETVALEVRPILNGVRLARRGVSGEVAVYTEREARLAALMPIKEAPDTSKLLLCPMPGLIKSIAVAVGDEVRAGDALCVVEAMKMENILRAEQDGVVKRLNAKPGDSLAVDAVIMEFA